MSNVSLRILLVLVTIGVMVVGLSLVMCAPAHAEKSLGIGIQQSADGELSVGITGEYEIPAIDIEYEYQGIDYHDAKIDLSYRQSLLSFLDVTVFQENDWHGYTFLDLNRTNDLGVSAIVAVGNVDLEFAIFGRNGNVAAPVTKYDPDTGLPVSETPGLTPVEGTNANVAFATAFDVKEVEIEAKVLTDMSEEPTPQWLLDARTSHKIGIFDWTLSAEYQGQRYKGSVEQSVSSMLTFGLAW